MKLKLETVVAGIFVVVAVTITFLTLSAHTSAAAMEQLEFKIYPKDVAVKENPVTVMATGKIYQESWWFDEVKANKFITSADERFVMKVVEVNANGTLEDQLSLWPQDEREEAFRSFGDPAFFKANQDYFKMIQASAFLAKIAYGPYLIFFLQHSEPDGGDKILDYPVLNKNGTYYMSNRMQADPIFNFLMQEIREWLKIKARPAALVPPQS